jgi:Asp-tRNA(Asn)/Glu-tRNA(Gln) amidotransferase A subunit family amidase
MTVEAVQSPVHAVDEALDRIAALDREVQAFIHVDAVAARRRAADLERRGPGRRRPLFGYTMGVKDLIDTRDMPTSYGSPVFAGHRPQHDATVVKRLRRAGAIVVGKTVTTEFATFDPPATRNPWDLACTPGGSSSGSAAAVAAGMVRAAIGTQTAGSTLRPASYCGVVGFVPSPGWIGRTGIFPCAASLDRVGLMARTTQDLRQLLVAATAFDPADADSIRAPRQKTAAPMAPDRLRVGLLMPLLEAASPAMASTVHEASRRLAASGATLRAISSSETFEAGFAALFTIMRAEIATVHADLYRRHRKRYAPQIASIVETGRRIPATEYIGAQETRRRYGAELDGWFSDLDVVLAPAATGAAERSHQTIGDPRMNIPATLAGLPALTIPAGLSDDRLPLGIQLIGRRHDDYRLLDAALCLEGLVNFQAPPVPRTSTD